MKFSTVFTPPFMAPSFSIIIPVYNVAPYLRECLDSVLSQTLTDWEAICIDDGSTDGSGAILDEYAAKDARFRVIHQANAGVSAARNVGLDQIRGRYFFFVDSDDYLKSEYIERLYSLVKDRPGWVGAIGWTVFPDGHPECGRKARASAWSGEHSPICCGAMLQSGSHWCKIYPTELLSAGARIRFAKNLRIGEDAVVAMQILSRAAGLIVDGGYNGYFYRERNISLSHGRSAYEMFACYWEDALVLSQSEAARNNPYVLREWMVRCVVDHLFGVSRLSEIAGAVRRMRSDDIELWRCLLELPDDPRDVQYRTWKYPVAHFQAKILLSWLPWMLQAVALECGRVYYRIKWRIQRIVARVVGAHEAGGVE